MALYSFRLAIAFDNTSAGMFFVASTVTDVTDVTEPLCWQLTTLVQETNAKWPRA